MLCWTGVDILACPHEQYQAARINRADSHKITYVPPLHWLGSPRGDNDDYHLAVRRKACFLWFLAWLTLGPCRWILYVVQKRLVFSTLYTVTTHKFVLYATVTSKISQKIFESVFPHKVTGNRSPLI
jgi:hypothetical protein